MRGIDSKMPGDDPYDSCMKIISMGLLGTFLLFLLFAGGLRGCEWLQGYSQSAEPTAVESKR